MDPARRVGRRLHRRDGRRAARPFRHRHLRLLATGLRLGPSGRTRRAKPSSSPMAEDEEAHYSHAGLGDVYPFTGSIRVYFNAAPGKPLEPWMAEYMRLALSKEGQQILFGHAEDRRLHPSRTRKGRERISPPSVARTTPASPAPLAHPPDPAAKNHLSSSSHSKCPDLPCSRSTPCIP